MERREFIKKSSLALGGALTSQFAFSKGFFDSKNFKGKIIIIGAGVSALYAADILQNKGCEVKILEASNQLGGRIKQHNTFASKPIDLGAQWLHGKSELLRYVQKQNNPIYKDDIESAVRIRYNNLLYEQFPSPISDLLYKFAKDKNNIADVSLLEYLVSQGYDEHTIQFCEFLATDAATQAKNISAKEVAKLIGKFNDGFDYQFSDNTFFQFIETHTPASIKTNIQYSTIVKSIDYGTTGLKIYDQDNTVYECDKVLITVPISILKQNKIEFFPNLTTDKISSFNAIGMDKGLKMFIKFNKKFYDYSVVNCVNTGYYVDATKHGHIADKGVFASLLMGKYAEAYYENPDIISNKIIEELDGYYKGQASKHFEEFYFQDWGNEPFIQGVYSYAKPGIKNNREQAQLPVDNRLFFAGEAYHNAGHNGTVHGAMETAKLATKQILKS